MSTTLNFFSFCLRRIRVYSPFMRTYRRSFIFVSFVLLQKLVLWIVTDWACSNTGTQLSLGVSDLVIFGILQMCKLLGHSTFANSIDVSLLHYLACSVANIFKCSSSYCFTHYSLYLSFSKRGAENMLQVWGRSLYLADFIIGLVGSMLLKLSAV